MGRSGEGRLCKAPKRSGSRDVFATPSGSKIERESRRFDPASIDATESEQGDAADSVTEIALPPLNAAESERIRTLEVTGPLRFGIGRDLPQGPSLGTTGRVLSLRLRSSGAAGIRLALQVSHLPDEAILRLSSPSAEARTISGFTLNVAIREEADVYWLPLIIGDLLSLDIELPVGADQVGISLAKVSHLYRLPATHSDSLACPEGWDLPSRATATLLHTDPAGDSGFCTGTLLADADTSTSIPYLLTAHHCVHDQATASSLETFWFPCGQDGTTVSGGADLLYTSKTTDTSLLRLRRSPPPGAAFADWSPTLPPQGTAVTGIHHPRGGSRQIAFGELRKYIACDFIDYCGEDRGREDMHCLWVVWSTGATGGGSSGSGLFLPNGQLVGTLTGGVDDRDYYGRFDIPYRAALHQWLGAAVSRTPPSAASGPN
jgi:lysyl endopeptidase